MTSTVSQAPLDFMFQELQSAEEVATHEPNMEPEAYRKIKKKTLLIKNFVSIRFPCLLVEPKYYVRTLYCEGGREGGVGRLQVKNLKREREKEVGKEEAWT